MVNFRDGIDISVREVFFACVRVNYLFDYLFIGSFIRRVSFERSVCRLGREFGRGRRGVRLCERGCGGYRSLEKIWEVGIVVSVYRGFIRREKEGVRSEELRWGSWGSI